LPSKVFRILRLNFDRRASFVLQDETIVPAENEAQTHDISIGAEKGYFPIGNVRDNVVREKYLSEFAKERFGSYFPCPLKECRPNIGYFGFWEVIVVP
jgi:hypothetical protein